MSLDIKTGREEVPVQAPRELELGMSDINKLYSQISLRHNRMAPHVARKHATRWTRSSKDNDVKGLQTHYTNKEDWHSPHPKDLLRKTDHASKKGKKDWKRTGKFNPQSGITEALPPVCTVIVKKLDMIVASLYAISNLEGNTSARVAVLHLLFRGMYPDTTDFDYILKLFGEILTPVEPQSSGSWTDSIRSVLTDWKLLKNHPMAASFSTLLSACALIGIIGPGKFRFSLGNLELFSQNVFKRQTSALDIFDALMETIMYFFEVGHAILTTGSLKPLLFMTKGADELAAEVSFLKANQHIAINGTIETIEGGCSIDEYRTRINACLLKLVDAISVLDKSSFEKSIMIKKMEEIETIRVRFESAHAASTQRLRPFAICVYSTSGCGKTTFVRETVVHILAANGFPCDDSVIVTLSDTDRFESTMKSTTQGVIDDDVANQKADYAPFSIAARVINFVNSKPYAANKAAVEDKGTVACNAKVYAASTNWPSLDAYLTSNNPASVLCRFSHLVTIKVKPEFCTPGSDFQGGSQLDSAKVFEFMEKQGEFEPSKRDVWNITVESPYVVPGFRGGSDHVKYTIATFEGREMRNVDYATYLRFMCSDSQKYFDNQKKIFSASLNVAGTIPKCSHGVPELAHCKHCARAEQEAFSELSNSFEEDIDSIPSEPQAGVLGATLGWFLRSWCNTFVKRTTATFIGEMRGLELATTQALFSAGTTWRNSILNTWTDYIPDSLINTALGKYVVKRTVAVKNARVIMFARTFFLGAMATSLYKCYSDKSHWCVHLGCLAVSAVSYKSFVVAWDSALEKRILEQRDLIPEAAKKIREEYVSRAVKMVGIAGFSYALVCVAREFYRAGKDVTSGVVYAPFGLSYNSAVSSTHRVLNDSGEDIFDFSLKVPSLFPTNDVFEFQGNLSPLSQHDIDSRNREVNPFKKVMTDTTFFDPQLSTYTLDQMCERVGHQLIHFSVLDGDQWRVCNGLCIASRVVLIPKHIVYDNQNLKNGRLLQKFEYRVIRRDFHSVGGVFQNQAFAKDVCEIPKSDFVLLYMPSLGDKRDISHLFKGPDFRGQCKLVYRNNKGLIDVFDSVVESRSTVKHSASPAFVGGRSCVAQGTFNGLCMAVYLSCGKTPTIVGFHLGGRENKSEGIYGHVSHEAISSALKKLALQTKDSFSVQSGVLPTSIMGVNYLTSHSIHPKCPTNFLETDCQIDILGSCVGRGSFRPKISNSLLSSHIEEQFGVPQRWGNPSTHPWKHERIFLHNAGNGAKRMDPNALEWATNDWVDPLVVWSKSCKLVYTPLTLIESVSGIDGDRWIDPMNRSTSVGFPLSGPKRNFLTPLDKMEWPEWECPYAMGPEIEGEYSRILSCYSKSERAFPVFKSCPKSEALSLDKDKKRMFQVAPSAFQVVVRQYFLPLAATISKCPLLSECSVGINCSSPEWEQMIAHLEQFPSSQCIAGDYKNWDQVISPDVTRAAWGCLIRLAISMGATPEHVHVMECIVSDMVSPVLAFEGTLLMIHNGNPSGQNLTAHINCVINSLLLRCVWWLSGNRDPFRNHVSLQVYGDDNLATTDVQDFNMNTIATYLGGFGYIYTDAFKNTTTTDFVELSDAEYLKRHSVYHKELGVRLGALKLDSIFKSLHCYDGDSKISRIEHAEAVVQSAIIEFFLHGPETYEDARSKLKEVCTSVGIVVPTLNKDYNTRADEWLSTHFSYSDGYRTTGSVGSEQERRSAIPAGSSVSRSMGLDRGNTREPGNCLKNEGTEEANSSTSGLSRILNEIELDGSNIHPQSGTVSMNVGGENTETWHQTLHFEDGSPGDVNDTGPMSLDTISGDVNQLSLGDFFRRPVLIHTAEWSQGIDSSFRINPWGLFILNPRISNRMANFARARFSLKVKVMITGNGFYYGRMMVAYLPLETFDQITPTLTSGLYLIEASQRPHILLDPSTSEGGTMELPFFFPDETYDVETGNIINGGILDFIDITELNHANGSGSPIRISVFAWSDNMELTCPTHQTPSFISPQSGTVERSKDSCDVLVQQTTMGAISNGENSPMKLTLNSSQSTTIDTRMMGLEGADELDIRSFVTRQAIIAKNSILPEMDVGTVLFSTKVNPGMYDLDGEPSAYHFTPVCWIQHMFAMWRGTMKFRFLVVGSAHHRGRLQITWDPNSTAPLTDTNVGYNYIVDIAEQRDFTIDVGWGARTGMLECPDIAVVNPPFSTDEHVTEDKRTSNGVLTLSVYDPITLPAGTASSVHVLVWVSAGDDMEFAAPRGIQMNDFQIFGPQSGAEPVTDYKKHSTDDDFNADNVVASFSSPPGHTDKALDIYAGEKISNLRTVISRMSFHSYWPVTDTQNSLVGSYVKMPTYPFFRGRDPLGFDTEVGDNYSFCNTIPLQWVMLPFTGYRGGINVHSLYVAKDNLPSYSMIHRNTFGKNFFQQGSIFAPGSGKDKVTAAQIMRSCAAGFAGNHSINNPSVTVTIPYHTTKKFLSCKRNDQLRLDANLNFQYFELTRVGQSLSTDSGTFLGFSAAPDFQVGFFTGTPVMYLIEETYP